MRVIAQDIFTKQFLHWDLPLDTLLIKKVLSGPNVLSGTLKTEIPDLMSLDPPLEPYRTWLHVEDDGGFIDSSYILMPYVDTAKAQTRTIEGEGFAGYPHMVYYEGEPVQGVQVDPADMIRLLWAHCQSYSDGNIGVQVSSTTTPVRIGTEPRDVNFTTSAGESVSFVAGPYALNFWTVKCCGDEIEDLCQETPIEYVERSEWNATKTDITHHIDLGYPRVGGRMPIAFREGENLHDLIPSYKEDKESYVSQIIVVGAGDGPTAIRAFANKNIGRVRKTEVIQNEDITTTARAQAIADFVIRQRSLTRYLIESVTVDTTHVNAKWGTFHVGDDILIEAYIRYVGKINDYHRIISMTYDPKTRFAVLTLKPSESFAYGADTGDD